MSTGDLVLIADELEEEQRRLPVHPTLFGTADPVAVIARAAELAKPLAELIGKQKLFVEIKGRRHVRIEGWTLLGSMLGVFPVTVWTRRTEKGWEARVEARTRSGEVVGAAEAGCSRDESAWKDRDDYALQSMAQTRASSKALKMPLGFVMQLAGFDPTPAEEMPRDTPRHLPKDPVARMYQSVAEKAKVPPDVAETAVYEAAGEAELVWPDPGLPPEQLKALWTAACARAVEIQAALQVPREVVEVTGVAK
jgi:hypothetical protein